MIEQDIFVGGVAVVTGLFVFGSAVLQSKWISKFWLVRHIENTSNGSVARFVLMGIGAICMVLGTLLILGFFANDSRREGMSEYLPIEKISFKS